MSGKDDMWSRLQREATGEEPETTKEKEPQPEEDEPYILPQLIPEKYMAFRLGKRRERLLIARAAQPMRFPAYHQLMDISFDQARQEGFIMFFHAMTVVVEGKNLWPVVHAISNGRCAGIYQYHKRVYPSLPDPSEPLIEVIKIEPPAFLTEN